MTREEIDQKYLGQANQLEADFFDIVDEGLPSQHRVLKVGKIQQDFDSQHALIWQNHEQELIANGYLEPPPEPEPPHSTHISSIDAIDTAKARPVRIKRVWEGKDYFHDCLVTESVKDQFVAGDVKVGDYVLVHFDAVGEQIVTAKVFKSW